MKISELFIAMIISFVCFWVGATSGLYLLLKRHEARFDQGCKETANGTEISSTICFFGKALVTVGNQEGN